MATGGQAPSTLPRGRHAAPREVVAASQRTRLQEAMAAVVAERGYGATAVADVLSRAGVSRKSFYEHFANKEACFLAAYDAGVDGILAAIDAAISAEDEPYAAVRAGAAAYLGALAGTPHFARTFLLEVLAAGPVAVEHRAAVHERFAEQLGRLYDLSRSELAASGGTVLPPLPRHRFQACVGAIDALVTEHVRRHGAAGLAALLDVLVDVQLTLLLGDPSASGPR